MSAYLNTGTVIIGNYFQIGAYFLLYSLYVTNFITTHNNQLCGPRA